MCRDTVISVQVDPVRPCDWGKECVCVCVGGAVCLQSEREVRLVSSVFWREQRLLDMLRSRSAGSQLLFQQHTLGCGELV